MLWVTFVFFIQTALPWVLRCSSAFLSTDAAKTAARVNSAPQRQVSASTTTWPSMLVQRQIKPDYSHHRAHFSHCRNKAPPVLHHVVEQWQRGSGKPESELPDLFLQQSPAVFSAPDGQQHQRSRCHLLSGGGDGLQSLLLLICAQILQWRFGNNSWKRLCTS